MAGKWSDFFEVQKPGIKQYEVLTLDLFLSLVYTNKTVIDACLNKDKNKLLSYIKYGLRVRETHNKKVHIGLTQVEPNR